MRRSFDGKKERLSLLLDGMPNDLVDSIGYDLFVQEYILPKEVARFFLFDAERITNLAESRGAQERKELASAYEKVLGVKRYQSRTRWTRSGSDCCGVHQRGARTIRRSNGEITRQRAKTRRLKLSCKS